MAIGCVLVGLSQGSPYPTVLSLVPDLIEQFIVPRVLSLMMATTSEHHANHGNLDQGLLSKRMPPDDSIALMQERARSEKRQRWMNLQRRQFQAM